MSGKIAAKQSRIGKAPIPVPSGVDVEIQGQVINVKGPKGALSHTVHALAFVEREDNQLLVKISGDGKQYRAIQGLTRSLVANMVEGVSQGFEKRLEMIGTGYRGAMKGTNLELQLGFSHPVVIEPEEGIELAMDGATKIVIRGRDKQKVGETAATIRRLREPNPYLGKGIRYEGEKVRRKAGKTGAK